MNSRKKLTISRQFVFGLVLSVIAVAVAFFISCHSGNWHLAIITATMCIVFNAIQIFQGHIRYVEIDDFGLSSEERKRIEAELEEKISGKGRAL